MNRDRRSITESSFGTTEHHGHSILTLTDVHAYVNTSHVLHGIAFEVPRQHVTVLLGRNGVGKTSTLRSILGLMQRTGSILFDGIELSSMPTHEIACLGIGYVPENRDVFHTLTVAENLRLAERRGQVPNYDRVYDVFPELKDRRRQFAGTLSGGQQQMVSVARALLNDNRLLLIDEPTKGLSPRLVGEVVASLERVITETTVVLVEQNLPAAQRLADYVVVVDQGTVVTAGPAAEVFADEARVRQLVGVSGPGNHHSGGDQ